MIDLKIFPQKILAYRQKGKHILYYSILPQITDTGTLIVYNPFYAQCFSLDRENLFRLKKNESLRGSLALDLSKGPPLKEIIIHFEIRTIEQRIRSNQQTVTVKFISPK